MHKCIFAQLAALHRSTTLHDSLSCIYSLKISTKSKNSWRKSSGSSSDTHFILWTNLRLSRLRENYRSYDCWVCYKTDEDSPFTTRTSVSLFLYVFYHYNRLYEATHSVGHRLLVSMTSEHQTNQNAQHTSAYPYTQVLFHYLRR